jgi:hypothetical protein
MAYPGTIAKATGRLPFVRGEAPDGLIIGLVEITGPSSYTTGGNALAAITEIDASLKEFFGLVQIGFYGTNAQDAYHISYDKTNLKILFHDELGEVPNATDIDDVTFICLYFGRG